MLPTWIGSDQVIPYGRQSISNSDIDAVVGVLRGDWLTTGPTVAEFEAALSERAGGASCVSVTSGTAALHVAYHAAGIVSGDEIITPPTQPDLTSIGPSQGG